jgi:hypothetical protein
MTTRSKTKESKKGVRNCTQIPNPVLKTNKIQVEDENDSIDYATFGKYNKDLFTSTIIPLTYSQAMSEAYREVWENPIQNELNLLRRLNVFDIVPRAPTIKPVPVKWLFIVKSDGRQKARVVAVGCKDTEKYEKHEIASPTPNSISVRWFLAFATQSNCLMKLIDIDTAFLNGKLDREKYILLPEGINVDRKKFIGKLNRPLYGLAIAPTCWNKMITQTLLAQGFRSTPRDPCLFVKTIHSSISVFLLLYIDDILIASISVSLSRFLFFSLCID